MTDVEKVEVELSVESGATEKGGQSAPERLAKLPLEALLYYVMYGDDGLTRLT